MQVVFVATPFSRADALLRLPKVSRLFGIGSPTEPGILLWVGVL